MSSNPLRLPWPLIPAAWECRAHHREIIPLYSIGDFRDALKNLTRSGERINKKGTPRGECPDPVKLRHSAKAPDASAGSFALMASVRVVGSVAATRRIAAVVLVGRTLAVVTLGPVVLRGFVLGGVV